MTTARPGRNLAPPLNGVRTLLAFHVALLAWWLAVQLFYRVVQRFMPMEPPLWFGAMSWGLIALAPFVFLRFARERRGTPAAAMAYTAVALAIVDLVGETLQFAPRFGLPSLMPSDKGLTELIVRVVWVSCEFSMRGAMFVALWRSQAGASKRVIQAFFSLVATHWVGAMITFLSATEQYDAPWTSTPVAALVVRLGWLLGPIWLSLLVWLNRRVARGEHPVEI